MKQKIPGIVMNCELIRRVLVPRQIFYTKQSHILWLLFKSAWLEFFIFFTTIDNYYDNDGFLFFFEVCLKYMVHMCVVRLLLLFFQQRI